MLTVPSWASTKRFGSHHVRRIGVDHMNRWAAAALIPAGLLQLAPALVGVPGITAPTARLLAGGTPRNHVAITFDDGPHPEGTPAVLAALAAFDVRWG